MCRKSYDTGIFFAVYAIIVYVVNLLYHIPTMIITTGSLRYAQTSSGIDFLNNFVIPIRTCLLYVQNVLIPGHVRSPYYRYHSHITLDLKVKTRLFHKSFPA